jgi:tetratricopeptide (TPR) repeat protein
MLLLSGDRGYRSDEELLLGEGEPRLTIHGSFSMMVDYQIIGDYCRNQGAQALHPEHRHDNLNISAFLFGDSPQGFAETRQAYAEGIGKFGPDDFFTLKSGIEQVYDVLGLDHLLAFLRLSGWDYKRFWECLPTLKNRLSEISEIQKRELYEAIQNVWDMYLPIGEENDLAFQLGTLLLELGFHVEAVRFLEYSIELYEVEPGTAYNLGVCYYSLQQPKAALEWVERALELAPDFAEARILREELASAVPVSRKVRRKRRA